MPELVKIPVEELQLGMTVARCDRQGVYFPFYGKPLNDGQAIDTLRKAGVSYVYIKASVSRAGEEEIDEVLEEISDEHSSAVQDAVKPGYFPVEEAPTLKEISRAKQLHIDAGKKTKSMLEDVRMGKTVDTSAAMDMVSDLVMFSLKSPHIFSCMTRLKDFDDYTYVHSLNVSILAISIGRRLGKSPEELDRLGLAGLLHDAGKMRIPEKILNKPGKLDAREFEYMKKHPELGYDIVKKSGRNVSEDVLVSILQHHEKADGTGYPGGLYGRQISSFAKIVSIADVYDAITSDRVYNQRRSPSEALKLIFSGSGTHFDKTLVKFFINIMGIYPVGTLTLLDSDELAVVFKQEGEDIMRPKVIVVTDKEGKQIDPVIFDLKENDIKGKPRKKIVSALNPREHNIDTNRIIDGFAARYSAV
ncbi:HD-GYP domain-containing protein [Limisalsivibrio acetivorans]|uniref:HD-GYP domain-containing protein n=1 Tax=Limisalsivibrio acetivorans TaxID=1304888 RepID=UPI0003B504BE|nr:HD-GYP domain-containing protein [Limisalsivibrio acetivorans]